MDTGWCSLREAARRSGLPVDDLRCDVLAGDLVAQPVDDDREYLVRVEDLPAPGRRPYPRPARPPVRERRREGGWRSLFLWMLVTAALLYVYGCTVYYGTM